MSDINFFLSTFGPLFLQVFSLCSLLKLGFFLIHFSLEFIGWPVTFLKIIQNIVLKRTFFTCEKRESKKSQSAQAN